MFRCSRCSGQHRGGLEFRISTAIISVTLCSFFGVIRNSNKSSRAMVHAWLIANDAAPRTSAFSKSPWPFWLLLHLFSLIHKYVFIFSNNFTCSEFKSFNGASSRIYLFKQDLFIVIYVIMKNVFLRNKINTTQITTAWVKTAKKPGHIWHKIGWNLDSVYFKY